ncbi:MAG TPA: tRNA pseudouridine(38-40) synthase TruA [Steroidobacteraceae bacterium]|nr:tRNA pseudouridine(38-40) synthase TruA [Steroidobacteraceae bacterium]
MHRIAVGVEYDGRAYAGWQSQASLPSIQAVTEGALSAVAAHAVSLVGAGRTDAGVHAVGQVAHFETSAGRSARSWVLGTNTHLPRDVSLTWARAVPEHFHARYSAEARTYCYLICNRDTRSALAAQRATMIHQRLDDERMIAAAATLLGEHDFSAFRSSECQARSPVRRLEELSVERRGEWLVIRVTANAFLHHMVRNLVGLLLAIGQAKAEPRWARDVLESRDRTRGAATAPPDGLYLWSVRYPRAFPVPSAGPDRAWAMIPGLMGFEDVLV